MKTLTTEEIQSLLLDMLRTVKDYCQDNHISFYAAGGTLLGTVRHHGFIPWDDDIDLFMKEKDFDSFLELARDKPYIDKNKRYEIRLPFKFPNAYPLIKIVDTNTLVYDSNVAKKFALGLWIDIFRMSYWPNDLLESKRLFRKQNRLTKLLQLVICGNLKELKYKIAYPFVFPIKSILIALGMDSEYWGKKLYQLGSSTPTDYIGNLSWASTINDRYPAKWYDETIEMPFEDMLLPVPGEYDKILTQFYKDYMRLPPVEKRVRHKMDAYYIN